MLAHPIHAEIFSTQNIGSILHFNKFEILVSLDVVVPEQNSTSAYFRKFGEVVVT